MRNLVAREEVGALDDRSEFGNRTRCHFDAINITDRHLSFKDPIRRRVTQILVFFGALTALRGILFYPAKARRRED
jgi:hypothetical protein